MINFVGGQWNRNTRRVRHLAAQLATAGYSVQLKLLEESQRDLVQVVSPKGVVLSQHKTLQHNSNYYEIEENCEALAKQALAALQQEKGKEQASSSELPPQSSTSLNNQVSG